MFDFIIGLFVFVGVSYYFGVFDFLVPTINRTAQKLGLKDEPRTQDNLGAGIDNLIGTITTVSEVFSVKVVGMAPEGRVKARGRMES